MDVCFDVPAKLCVLHLIAMALFVIAPSARRLVDVFVRNRAAAPVDLGPPRSRRVLGVKAALIALVVYVEGVPVAQAYFTERDGAPLPPLHGAYEVVELRRSGEEVPPLLGDATYWRLVTVDRRRTNAITTDGTRVPLGATVSITRADEDGIAVDGTYEGRPIAARARRVDPKKLSLVSQPARWFIDRPDIH
jgi:hypothetical protein